MTVAIVGKHKRQRADSRNVLRGQRTRRRILDAARARILAAGFEALHLDDLAEDAGVTKAAVVRSTGGKASILLELGDEDRATRLAAVREARGQRTGLKRRLRDLARRLFELDLARLNVAMAYIGYMWFWAGADHERARAMVRETREELCELIAAASPERPSADRLRILSLRFLGAYVIGLRDLKYGDAGLDETVDFVVDYCLA